MQDKSIDRPVYIEELAHITAEVYPTEGGGFSLVIRGDQLAYFCGEFPTLEDCREQIESIRQRVYT